MVERLKLKECPGGIRMAPAKDGGFVRYSDYEALEREVKELREKLYVQRESKEYAQRCCISAEATIARLSEALRGIKAAILEADTAVLTDTLWMPDRLFKGGTVVDFIDAALSGSNSGWQPRETVPADDGTIIEVQILEQVQRWNAARFHNAFDGDPRDFRWRLPAAPQPTGGE